MPWKWVPTKFSTAIIITAMITLHFMELNIICWLVFFNWSSIVWIFFSCDLFCAWITCVFFNFSNFLFNFSTSLEIDLYSSFLYIINQLTNSLAAVVNKPIPTMSRTVHGLNVNYCVAGWVVYMGFDLLFIAYFLINLLIFFVDNNCSELSENSIVNLLCFLCFLVRVIDYTEKWILYFGKRWI